MNTPNSNVARIVRTLLTYQGKSRAELARSLGLHVSAVNKAINGQRSWDVNDLVAMAEFFEVSPALFFENSDSLIRTVGITQNQDDPSGTHISNGTTQRECGDNSLDETLLQLAA